MEAQPSPDQPILLKRQQQALQQMQGPYSGTNSAAAGCRLQAASASQQAINLPGDVSCTCIEVQHQVAIRISCTAWCSGEGCRCRAPAVHHSRGRLFTADDGSNLLHQERVDVAQLLLCELQQRMLQLMRMTRQQQRAGGWLMTSQEPVPPSRGRALASAGVAGNHRGSLVQKAYQD